MTTYEPTRRGKRKFLQDLIPGKTYYSVVEAKQSWGDEPMYYEWIFKIHKFWGPVSGHMSAGAVLANYGPLTDTKPSGMKGLFDKPKQLHDPFGNNGKGYEEYQQLNAELQGKSRRKAGVR